MVFVGELQGMPCNNLGSRFRSGPTPRYAGRDDADENIDEENYRFKVC